MCIDYQMINQRIMKNCYPLPSIDDSFDQLWSVKICSQINLRSRYHQMKVKEVDVPNIAFHTQHGHYEFLIMPFRLINASMILLYLINRVLQPYLNKFMIILIIDVYIYLENTEKHWQHMDTIL